MVGAARTRAAAVAVTVVVGVAVAGLTALALRADADPSATRIQTIAQRPAAGQPPSPSDRAVLAAREYNLQRERAARDARRAMDLASRDGIPPEGPLALLENDSETRGPVLFAVHCASCHRFRGHDGLGRVPAEAATSSDLGWFGTRRWVEGMLRDPMDESFMGRMKKPDGRPAHTRMGRFLTELRAEQSDPATRQQLDSELAAVASYLDFESTHPGELAVVRSDRSEAATFLRERAPGDAPLRRPAPDPGEPLASASPPDDRSRVVQGRLFFMRICNECHSYAGERSGTQRGPEMRGYGSPAWIADTIADPSQPARYGSTGREPAQMPAFKDRLSERDRRLLAQWLHQAARQEQP
jgi:ubiquinol-cytochrome c reductase cytochrome b subunit